MSFSDVFAKFGKVLDDFFEELQSDLRSKLPAGSPSGEGNGSDGENTVDPSAVSTEPGGTEGGGSDSLPPPGPPPAVP